MKAVQVGKTLQQPARWPAGRFVRHSDLILLRLQVIRDFQTNLTPCRRILWKKNISLYKIRNLNFSLSHKFAPFLGPLEDKTAPALKIDFFFSFTFLSFFVVSRLQSQSKLPNVLLFHDLTI